ncbi:MAG TPA: M28 family peptidase, partial [Longimicrobiales bacterium]|nr:M28 family peptidase [Longimicrobiales bacterium]
MPLFRSVALAAATVLAAAFTFQDPVEEALAAIDASDLRAHLFFLSHDRLRGRAPGTPGGQAAALYIASQLARAGVQGPAAGYFQPVPLRGVRTLRSSLHFQLPDVRLQAQVPDDAILWTGTADTLVDVGAELVFVGYGTHAPEYDWDDFGEADLSGKVLLVLVNEPPAPPDEPDLFDGRAMTYYGRWTYKLEEAARRGAAGALLIHSSEAAGYDWRVVRSSWTGEQLFAASPEARRLPLEGWISRDLAREILTGAPHSLEELAVRAARRDFRPLPTGIRVQARVASRVRPVTSSNVVGIVPGSDPELRDEAVVFTSHYDHLGVGVPVNGDSIYNGAYDNASGVAVLIEMAAAFATMVSPP